MCQSLPIIGSEEDKGIFLHFIVPESQQDFSNSPVHFSDCITKLAPYCGVGKLLSSKLRMMCMLEGQV